MRRRFGCGVAAVAGQVRSCLLVAVHAAGCCAYPLCVAGSPFCSLLRALVYIAYSSCCCCCCCVSFRLAYGKNVVDHVAEARSLGVNQVVIFPKVRGAV
jgi:hypothetical protein